MRNIVEKNYRRAREILSTKLNTLHLLAAALLEYETLDGEEVERIIQGLKIQRKAPVHDSKDDPTAQTVDSKSKNTGTEGAGPTPAPVPA